MSEWAIDQDGCITFDKKTIHVKGTWRLMGPANYQLVFYDPINEYIQKNCNKYDIFCFDFTKMNYINSSGITSLARLCIEARKNRIKFDFKHEGNSAIKNSINSILKLNEF